MVIISAGPQEGQLPLTLRTCSEWAQAESGAPQVELDTIITLTTNLEHNVIIGLKYSDYFFCCTDTIVVCYCQ